MYPKCPATAGAEPWRFDNSACHAYPINTSPDSPGLLDLANVVLTPLIGSAEQDTRETIAGIVVDNTLACASGDRPPNMFNREVFDR